jgi:hypothetical protein
VVITGGLNQLKVVHLKRAEGKMGMTIHRQSSRYESVLMLQIHTVRMGVGLTKKAIFGIINVMRTEKIVGRGKSLVEHTPRPNARMFEICLTTITLKTI